jgi:hypothetical protein
MTLAELKQVNGLVNQKKLVIGQPLLVPMKGGAENASLPDLPVNPVPLQKAFIAATTNAHTRKLQPAQGRKVLVERPSSRVAKRSSTVRHAGKPAQLRADAGKRVKVVAAAAPKKAAARPAGKVKVAPR